MLRPSTRHHPPPNRTLDLDRQPDRERSSTRIVRSSRSTSFAPPPADSLAFIVDDDESVRRSLERLLRSADVRSESFSSAQCYLQRAPHHGPHCLILDVRMPGLDGLELQRTLTDRRAQIIFLTGHGDIPMCAEAMKGGAVDFLTKPVDDSVLLNAVAKALNQSADLRRLQAERAAVRTKLDALTPREFEVMQRVIAGWLNKQIADQLGAAEKTIKIHRGRVMEKMGVTSVADLVRVAQTGGITPAAAAHVLS